MTKLIIDYCITLTATSAVVTKNNANYIWMNLKKQIIIQCATEKQRCDKLLIMV